MEKVYRHRKTGELAYYKDGIFKQGRFCVEIGVEPSSEFWEEVLFTTEDDEDIFEGDDYYYINKEKLDIVYVEQADKRFDSKKEGLLDFKYKSNAEEYILMNKPLLSLNDLLSVWGNNDEFDAYKNSPMFQNFKNLAKTKL